MLLAFEVVGWFYTSSKQLGGVILFLNNDDRVQLYSLLSLPSEAMTARQNQLAEALKQASHYDWSPSIWN